MNYIESVLAIWSGIMKQTFEYAVDKEYTDKNPYRVNVSNKKIIPDRKKASREEV